MNTDLAVFLVEDMLWTAIKVGAPILVAALGVGLLVSIIQVVTSVQEMTLTFVPKILVIVFVIMVLGHWMLTTLTSYASQLIANIPAYF